MALAHKLFGRRGWRDLLSPARKFAAEGIVVDWPSMLMLTSALADLRTDPGCAARFSRNGVPPLPPPATSPEDTVRLPMPHLAKTLGIIADEGAQALYKGPLARTIAADLQNLGGCLSEDDLSNYEARSVAPLEIAYRGRAIHVLPELNGGPTLARAFEEPEQAEAEVKPSICWRRFRC
jgi:gamma-glutamyltranspeptidase/glutathione hydrolase